MGADVVVTGFGVRTAFGAGAPALRHGVFGGRPAFAPTSRFDTGPYRTPMAAAAPDGPSGTGSLRPELVACGAEALDMAGLPAGEAAVLVGAAGDYTTITHFWRSGDDVEGATAPYADAVPAVLAEAVADGLGLRGPRFAFTNACVASSAAIIHACRLIASGRIEVALCAGGYLVEEEVFAKFDSGRALARDGAVRPFSADRSGLLLGDGVAAVVLESAGHARSRGARPLSTVAGWGAASDAYHIARPHPDGAGLAAAARQALRRAGDPAGATIDYVNAHGTGTRHNDVAETRGLRSVFGARAGSVPVSSTKSTTGHLLEAAGVVEFVITMLALTDGVLPPTAGYTRPDPECDLDCVPHVARPADARRALTLNAAFGGANTALVLERP
ncbi:beta-ketoacyl-[acyl-carrier-protein] synthase family protein [Actinoplanes sp. NEAU-A12]|uniref:Beta-ketoacyl-[acyl-carrier-protein] synthase family protein n=1 Tax=Actinoplanes sandaracinus TaxID=3045177 RepID=A0ABT6WXX3_9ACTN|nr:beta-ketoacyl-[acyl-carrier-protein] synthase family protein [Actinoplanes sandaracinus]MDI6104595.1 beta-ketoacyl-[acyl-carrier-protein] synthase family protein [Actinoplanes sandaracinus]